MENISNQIQEYNDKHLNTLLEDFTNKVFSESDFTEVDRIINFINTSSSTGKNNIIYKFSKAFNDIKYNNIPLLRYIFVEAYKLMSNDANKFDISEHSQLYINDLYFHLMKYKGSNEKVRTLRYYLMMINIIWLIDFKGSNIYFLVQTNEHDEYYNQLLFHLISKFNNKIESASYLGFNPRIIYGSYVYGDILEYKFKNYNTLVDNVKIYKLLHKIYINNKGSSDEEYTNLLKEGILNDKHISKKYKTEESIDSLLNLLKNPYSSEVDILGICGYGEGEESCNSISEEKLNTYSNKPEQVDGKVDDIIDLIGGDSKDPYFFVMYDVLFDKINTVVLHQLKDFENNYVILNKVLGEMFNKLSDADIEKNKILLNNLNFIQQGEILAQRQSHYTEEYKMIRSKF